MEREGIANSIKAIIIICMKFVHKEALFNSVLPSMYIDWDYIRAQGLKCDDACRYTPSSWYVTCRKMSSPPCMKVHTKSRYMQIHATRIHAPLSIHGNKRRYQLCTWYTQMHAAPTRKASYTEHST